VGDIVRPELVKLIAAKIPATEGQELDSGVVIFVKPKLFPEQNRLLDTGLCRTPHFGKTTRESRSGVMSGEHGREPF